MKWKTLEIILLVTRLIGLLFFIYTTICFGVLEEYNLDGIGNESAYTLYWNCLLVCCLFILIDCIAQIIKVANPKVTVSYIIQALLYIASVAIVIIIIANYPNLICDGDRNYSLSFWGKAEQIRSVRECVIFDSIYIGGRSLLYFVILVLNRLSKEGSEVVTKCNRLG